MPAGAVAGVGADSDQPDTGMIGDAGLGWSMVGGGVGSTTSDPVAASADVAEGLLGNTSLGWDMLGGGASESTDPAPIAATLVPVDSVLGGVGLGWGMLGGDAAAPAVLTDRRVQVFGTSTWQSTVNDVDRSVTVSGSASAENLVLDRRVRQHGAATIALRLGDRSVTVSGTAATSTGRAYSFTLTVATAAMRDTTANDTKRVQPLTTFYT